MLPIDKRYRPLWAMDQVLFEGRAGSFRSLSALPHLSPEDLETYASYIRKLHVEIAEWLDACRNERNRIVTEQRRRKDTADV
jgi:hypothetical protein